MKQKRRSPIEDFPELDQLVLKEIEAMVEHSYAEVKRAQEAQDRVAAESRRPVQKKAQPQPPRASHIRQPQAKEELLDWESDALEPESAEKELLSGEERQFVDHTVAWLQGRPNPDILIASIWSRVVDSDPRSFRGAAAPPTDPYPSNENMGGTSPHTGEENTSGLP